MSGIRSIPRRRAGAWPTLFPKEGLRSVILPIVAMFAIAVLALPTDGRAGSPAPAATAAAAFAAAPAPGAMAAITPTADAPTPTADAPTPTADAPTPTAETPTPAADASTPAAEAAADTAAAARRVIAYYFHTTQRCVSCRKIEEYTRTSLEEAFPAELKSGRLVWRVVNIDEKGNEHFTKDYQLYTKSVVLVDERNGKQAAWKNLAKVWEYLNNKTQFVRYVQLETRAYLTPERS